MSHLLDIDHEFDDTLLFYFDVY